jgi:NAD(P)-dependent dehydrogenase (short-subunit alcohol dehydrogenase family)
MTVAGGAWTARFSLAGRRALVTGASKGIGAEICAVFADAGADIVAVARDAEGLAATRAAVEATGRRCRTLTADLAAPEGPGAAAAAALAEGPVDILVNAAGVALTAPALSLGLDAWEATMAINLRAPFLLAQAVAPGMIARRRGKIVNISSQTGVIALDDHAAYATSKGALNALTKSLAAEWARHNVQVNAICPTVIMTPMGRTLWSDPAKADPFRNATPLRRFGEPVEVADAALYLAAPASDLVNGALLMLEGGFTSV